MIPGAMLQLPRLVGFPTLVLSTSSEPQMPPGHQDIIQQRNSFLTKKSK
jgi:hypothetical protein